MRAHKIRCKVCGRVIPASGCPMAPHVKLSSGRILRPIKRTIPLHAQLGQLARVQAN